MKNMLYAAILLLTIMISACQKEDKTYSCASVCATCSKTGDTDIIICSSDYGTISNYNDVVDVYIANNYSCINSVRTKNGLSESERNALPNDIYTCTEE